MEKSNITLRLFFFSLSVPFPRHPDYSTDRALHFPQEEAAVLWSQMSPEAGGKYSIKSVKKGMHHFCLLTQMTNAGQKALFCSAS